MTAFVIVNPSSGGGKTGRVFDAVRRVIERRIGAVDVEFTSEPGHGIALARRAAVEGRTPIVAVGGDGTLHEVVNGVLDSGRDVAVGYVGQGTGGDFRRTLGIAHRLDAYVDALARGRTRTIDAGRVRYEAFDGGSRSRWFLNILSVGMGGLVDRRVARTSRALGGRVAYLVASLGALAASRRGRIRCTVRLAGKSDERVVTGYMIAICNGRFFGSGMHVAPMATPDDGRFEVVTMDAESKVAFAAFSRHIYAGTHLGAAGTDHFGCDRIRLELENRDIRDVFLLDVDGEPLGCLPVEIELVPKALRIVA
jgi:YegS/Rv2252/BmrU family lipid kinase